MFDYRYHALSLAAVLLALVIGLLLGVAIGDKGLASQAQENLRADLRAEVGRARDESDDLRDALERRADYEEQTLPLLVGGRLEDRRIALVLLGESSPRTFEFVRDVVTQAGGEMASVSRLQLPLDLGRLANAAGGTRYEGLDDDPALLEPFGRRVGEQMVSGGRFVRDIRGALFASSSGALAGAEALVIARAEPVPGDEEQVERQNAFVDALLEGVEQFEVPVVGVELTGTDPSQVEWYKQRGIASVDSIDVPSGRAALVFALIGAADRAYGVKSTSDALLPETVTRQP